MIFPDIRSWPIRRQMLFLGIFPALLIFILLIGYFVHERLNGIDSALHAHGLYIAGQLAPGSEYSVISGNIEDIEKLVMPFLADDEVFSISISDVNNNVLFHAYGGARHMAPDGRKKQNEKLFFSKSILRQPIDVDTFQQELSLATNQAAKNANADKIGEVLVVLSTVKVDREKHEILLASVIPAVITFLLAIFLARLIGNVIVNPVIRLSEVARRIKLNDYSARVNEVSGGELGCLESDINQMARALQNAEAEQKDLLEQMRIARERAESGSQAKSDFLAMMSHEIRTPMNGVLGMLQLLETTSLTERQAEYSRVAIDSTLHLLGVINDILEFARVEREQLKIQPVYFEPKPLIESIVSMFHHIAVGKGLLFSVEYHGDFNHVQVMSDPARLRQVLLNLISNAIKFTEQGSVSLGVQIDRVNEKNLEMVIRVKDTGPGIPADKLEKIFLPFMQLDSSMSRTHGGTGLGLTIAHKITDLLDGDMEVSSKEGEGSCFTCKFTFPYIVAASIVVNEPASGIANGEKPKSTGRVLLVEDNAVNRMVALEMLQIAGVEVDIAEDGQEACAMYRPNYYNCIFMDVQMPLMDGLQVARIIRKTEQEQGSTRTPIIALTAYALQGEQLRCIEAGMDDYLSKPFRQSEIKDKLERWSVSAT